MLPANQQLQHQCRAVDHLPPAALVFGIRDPSFPELCCLVEALLYELHLGLLPWWAHSPEHKRGSLAGPEREVGHYIFRLLLQRSGGIEGQWWTRVIRRIKNSAARFDIHRVFAHSIVESGLA